MSDLPQFFGTYVECFPMVAPKTEDAVDPVIVGSVALRISFSEIICHDEASLAETLADCDTDRAVANSCQLSDSSRDEDEKSSIGFDGMEDKDCRNEYLPTPSSSSVGSESALSLSLARRNSVSVRSLASTMSSVSIFSNESKEAWNEYKTIFNAFFGTGWEIYKKDRLRSTSLLMQYFERHPLPRTHQVISNTQKLRIIAYFMSFALVSYGAAALNFFGYGKGVLRDFMSTNPDLNATLSHLELTKKDLLAWDYGLPKMFKPSFFIVHDKRTDSIVVSFRGTFSLHEVLADMNTRYDKFQNGLCHQGIGRIAQWMDENYFDKIVGWIKQLNVKALYLVGHSLGAGTGSLFLMRTIDRFKAATRPELIVHGYFFGPPPCASTELLDRYSQYMDAFINEYDIIPRLSYGALLDLKHLMNYSSEVANDRTMSKDEKLSAIHKMKLELKEKNDNPRIYVPGHLYYIYKTSRVQPRQRGKSKTHNNAGKDTQDHTDTNGVRNPVVDTPTPHYVVERTTYKNFEDMYIRSNMIWQHLPYKYDNGIRKAHDWLVDFNKAENSNE